jgi:uncharacterized protein YjdB
MLFFFQSLVKNYDQDMDTLTKQQKQQVEKAEGSQSIDLRTAAKRIKIEQVKYVSNFCKQFGDLFNGLKLNGSR